jgi:hypothetical protein
VTFEERCLPDSPERAAGVPLPDPRLNPRARRELILLLILIACGLFLVPLAIWVVGSAVLGPYAGGSPFSLLVDFFVGLKSGSAVYWCVVVGPYVFVQLLRLFWYYIRRPAA